MRGSHLGLFGSIAAGALLSACATAPVSDTATEASEGEAIEEIVVTGTARDDARTEAGMAEPEPVMAEAPPPPSAPPAPPPPPGGYGAMESRSLSSSKDASSGLKGDRAPAAEIEKVLPQSGQLTAGDYDDVLNPELYQAYLERKLQDSLGSKDLPYIDAKDRITIKAVDRLGKPVPLGRISMTTADGQPMFPLRTGADGKAYLYPRYDALEPGMVVEMTMDGAPSLKQTLSENMLEEGGVLTFDMSADRQKVTKFDLLLTLDATGSMGDEMAYLQSELVAILDRVANANDGLSIHAGLVAYRDVGDDYVTRAFDFTGDLEAFKADLKAQQAQGGGDMPESMHTAMAEGLDLTWRDDAIKVNLLVADAPPPDSAISATWDSGLISRSRGIHIVPLAASGVDETAEFLMRSMGQLTGGRYLFLTDDSGIGNPHAEPTVDCYVVTRLDGLVQRVLQSLVTGMRVEPEGEEVIRTVGNYRAGICQVDESPAT